MSALSVTSSPSVRAAHRGRVYRSGPPNTYGITGPTKAGHEYNKLRHVSREFPVLGGYRTDTPGESNLSQFLTLHAIREFTSESSPRLAIPGCECQKPRK